MKFFGSSLDMAKNLKVAFLGEILSNMSWHLPQKRIVPLLYLVINMTDWLSRVFLKLLLHLVTAVEREVSILLRGKPKEQVQHATKISQADLSSTQLVRAKSTERQAHRPQLKFITQPVPNTVVQFHRIDKSKKPEPVTRHIFGLFDFFSKYATFELSLMSNDENKFLPIFQILHIKNAWFLLELDMALVTTIEMRFALVCLRRSKEPQRNPKRARDF